MAAFVGALVFVLLQNFAIDLVDRERFNLVIGGIFLLIVLFSPDGLLGLWRRHGQRLQASGLRNRLGQGRPSQLSRVRAARRSPGRSCNCFVRTMFPGRCVPE